MERSCQRCPDEAGFVLNGEHLCGACARGVLSATAIDLSGPALDHEWPVEQRKPQKLHADRVRSRSTKRSAAERRTVNRLKLRHLPEYQTLLAEQMVLDGQAPPKARPLDVHLRFLASRRLLDLTRRA